MAFEYVLGILCLDHKRVIVSIFKTCTEVKGSSWSWSYGRWI